MNGFRPAICWALVMIALAIAARFGWADREAVETLLLITPILAITALFRSDRCGRRAREA